MNESIFFSLTTHLSFVTLFHLNKKNERKNKRRNISFKHSTKLEFLWNNHFLIVVHQETHRFACALHSTFYYLLSFLPVNAFFAQVACNLWPNFKQKEKRKTKNMTTEKLNRKRNILTWISKIRKVRELYVHKIPFSVTKWNNNKNKHKKKSYTFSRKNAIMRLNDSFRTLYHFLNEQFVSSYFSFFLLCSAILRILFFSVFRML